MNRAKKRCAIYTRKSSDEGLDQSFNSLDAQREAGEAYVKSQAHEGWTIIPTCYDDGGYSGGTMERPALQRLLADIDAGLVDVVVVYKIDRLTRSLPDFARIVERFDAHEVSFVSVTQAFNTTSSMGRLTLNVLLSFAQFEREVTGERIRDKIAASKAKGMWMGGILPLGYDLPAAGTRTLQVNHEEAETVRHIFRRYLALGSVHALQRELVGRGVISKQWTSSKGKIMGGVSFSRGALFHLLRNPVYLGYICHKGKVHQGEHEAIVDQALFDEVQERLDQNARRYRAAPERKAARAPLTGKLFDAHGEPMSPCFSQGRSGKLYRYYVSASLQQGSAQSESDIIQRVSAPAIEKLVTGIVERLAPSASDPVSLLLAVHLRKESIHIDVPAATGQHLAEGLLEGEQIVFVTGDMARVEIPVALPLRGGQRLIIASNTRQANPDPVLIAALRKAHRMVRREHGQPFVDTAPVSPYDRKILRLAFLAPDIQQDILKGLQPRSLNLERLQKLDIPLSWNEQRRALGWQGS